MNKQQRSEIIKMLAVADGHNDDYVVDLVDLLVDVLNKKEEAGFPVNNLEYEDPLLFLLKYNKKLKDANIIEIELDNPPIYQYIDEQCNQVISRINIHREEFELDDGLNDSSWLSFGNLSVDQVAFILDEIEDGSFEVTEEYDKEGDLE